MIHCWSFLSQVSVFGFGADQYGNWHHYWEENSLAGAFRHTGVHDGDYEYNVTLLLADKHKIQMFKGRWWRDKRTMNFYSCLSVFLSTRHVNQHAYPRKAILHWRCTFYVLFPGSQTKCRITAFISSHGRVDLMHSSLSSVMKQSHKIKALAAVLRG